MKKQLLATALITVYVMNPVYANTPTLVKLNAIQTVKIEKETTVTDLTVKDAIEKAKKHSNALITVDENRAAIAEEIERAGQVLETVAVTSGYTVTTDSLYNNLISGARNQMNLAANSLNKTQQEELIELSINSLFTAIISVQNDVSLKNRALKLEEKELEIEKSKLNLGLISQSAFNTKQEAYNKSIKAAGDLKRQVETAFEELNFYMGEDADARYNLIMDIEYEPLTDVDLSYHITYSINSSPEILQKAHDLELAEFDLKITTNSSSSWVSRNNKVSQANRSLGEAKKSLEEKIRKTYKSVMDIEEQIARNDEERINLEGSLKIKEVQYKNGLITELELEKASFALTECDSQRQKLVINHYLEKLSFEKPY